MKSSIFDTTAMIWSEADSFSFVSFLFFFKLVSVLFSLTQFLALARLLPRRCRMASQTHWRNHVVDDDDDDDEEDNQECLPTCVGHAWFQ